MENNKSSLFSSVNYKLLFLGIAISVVGFILMIGGGSEDGVSFNPEIFNFQRITLAPILILLGLIVDVFAIMKGEPEQK